MDTPTELAIELSREFGIRKEYVRDVVELHAMLASAFGELAKVEEKLRKARKQRDEWKARAIKAEADLEDRRSCAEDE